MLPLFFLLSCFQVLLEFYQSMACTPISKGRGYCHGELEHGLMCLRKLSGNSDPENSILFYGIVDFSLLPYHDE
jgi:hypothetical protein